MTKIGIIGGSGLYEIDGFEFIEEVSLSTEYGQPSDSYRFFKYGDLELFFLNRHGRNHSYPPHLVNYRANIDGFAQIGVKGIFSFTATGGINRDYRPGDIIVPDNGIDFTGGRKHTYFEENNVHHIDFTEPFCPDLRKIMFHAAERANVPVCRTGTYICTNGPRLETAAEIRAYDRMGADLVGMTLFPECSLAREKEICYTNISVITNFAAGTSPQKLTSDEVVAEMQRAGDKLKRLMRNLPASYTDERTCGCITALEGTKISK